MVAVVLGCPPRAQGCQTLSSLALLQHNLAPGLPGASCCSALLCLRPTFLLRHTAPAPLLIYNPEGEGVNAEEPDKKNLICSLSLFSLERNISNRGEEIFPALPVCSFDRPNFC